ncbi:hypothetical protein OPV22_011440 [Ensete ventricosum]|uniref:Uncharacterized protein n=1 Tax=Ensete ventricosum TaxID=4639 RepID=A0AAV8R9P4_ENSVE|nr:hypothetical protein OPV22_011440 [Ensete ventricosum]
MISSTNSRYLHESWNAVVISDLWITSGLWISDFVPWRFFLFLCYALPLRRRIRSGFSANLDRSSDKPQAMIKPESALYCLERCSSVRMRKRSLMMRLDNRKFSRSCVLLDLALMNEPTGTTP